MRREFDKVEIQEPPIKKLKKGRSCIKRSCWASCGCLAVLVIAFLLVLKFITVPRPKELKNVPAFFPQDFPLYDEQNIESITYTSTQSRNRAFEIAAYLPKAIIIPIYMASEDHIPDGFKTTFENSKTMMGWQRFIYLMKQPITEKKDIIEIEWIDLPAKPEFIESYYSTELKKQNYNHSLLKNKVNDIQVMFDKNNIQGVIHIEDDPKEYGTDLVKLKLSLPIDNY